MIKGILLATGGPINLGHGSTPVPPGSVDSCVAPAGL